MLLIIPVVRIESLFSTLIVWVRIYNGSLPDKSFKKGYVESKIIFTYELELRLVGIALNYALGYIVILYYK